MSLIFCSAPCIYQQEGQCTLVRAASPGPRNPHGCLNFVPAVSPSQQGGQGLPDVAHPDELQPLGDRQLALGALGNQALGEAQPPHLGQPLAQGAHRPQLPGEAHLPDGGEVGGDGAVPEAGGHGQNGGQVGGGLVQGQAADDV